MNTDIDKLSIALSIKTAERMFDAKTNEYNPIAKRELDLVFSNNERLYLPFKIELKDVLKSSKAKRIKTYISQKLEVEEFDYIKGKVKAKKQTYKIGKLLKDNVRLAKEFQQDPARISEELLVVISRNPLDIIKMSTDRGWASCMTLDIDSTGLYSGFNNTAARIIQFINEGGLISYLIRKKDKDIQDPLSRILIKPYYSDRGYLTYHASKVYGLPNIFYYNFVKKWAKINLPPPKPLAYFTQVYKEPRDPCIIMPKNKTVRTRKGKHHIAYYRNGKIHRENGPAVIFRSKQYNGLCKEWWKDGVYHRDDGPALIYGSSYKEWMQNNNHHRLDGPAIEMFDDKDPLQEWWIDGEEYTNEKSFKIAAKKYEEKTRRVGVK